NDFVPTFEYWPHAALVPDGSVMVAWVSWSWDTTAVSSAVRWRRMTSSGSSVPGWPSNGLEFAPYNAEFLYENASSPKAGLLALSPDGRGGFFIMTGQPVWEGMAYALQTRLFRLRSDGFRAVGWPDEVRRDPWLWYVPYLPVDGGFEIMPDGADGAFFGQPVLYD